MGSAIGDEIPLTLVDDDRPAADQTATVAGIYEAPEGAPDLGAFIIGLDDFTAAAPSSSDAQIFVQIADGATVAEVQPEIEQIVAPTPPPTCRASTSTRTASGASSNVFLLPHRGCSCSRW